MAYWNLWDVKIIRSFARKNERWFIRDIRETNSLAVFTIKEKWDPAMCFYAFSIYIYYKDIANFNPIRVNYYRNKGAYFKIVLK